MAFSAEAVKIAQKAQAAATLEPMTKFEQEDSLAASVSSELYEEFIQALLVQEAWRFAMTQATLDHLAEEPIGRWSDAWQLPTDPDVLAVRAITVEGRIVRFERYADKIYLNIDENSEVVMDYVYRVEEKFWPPDFRMFVILAFGTLLAASITRNSDVIESLAGQADAFLSTAVKNHSQGRTATKVNTKRIVNRRR